MCRFAFYMGYPITLSSLLTEPDHSLIRQSLKSEQSVEATSGDGFGVGWYTDIIEEPTIFKSTSPAWNNTNLHEIAQSTVSKCILAHIRAASVPNSISIDNCHPFKINDFMFCHNGYIHDFNKIRRHVENRLSDDIYLSVRGRTDSEYFFALFAENLSKITNKHDQKNMARAFEMTLREIKDLMKQYTPDQYAYLNCVITDGKRAIISRYTSSPKNDPRTLYTIEGKRYLCDHGQSKLIESDNKHIGLLVSSEPISKSDGWEEVPTNTIILIDKDLNVSKRKIDL